MTSLRVICGLGPPPIKNPGYAYVLHCLRANGGASSPGNATAFNCDRTLSVITQDSKIHGHR